MGEGVDNRLPLTVLASCPPPVQRGVQGSGACLCFPDYKGIACHICSTEQAWRAVPGRWVVLAKAPAREIKGLLARWAGTPKT